MTGDEEPRPGISTFQRMFFVSLHSVGGLACFETPVACGPRHCGQKRSAVAAMALVALWRGRSPVASTALRRAAVAGSDAARSATTRTIGAMRKNAALTRTLLAARPRFPGEDPPRSMSVVWRDDTPSLAGDRLGRARARGSLCRAYRSVAAVPWAVRGRGRERSGASRTLEHRREHRLDARHAWRRLELA